MTSRWLRRRWERSEPVEEMQQETWGVADLQKKHREILTRLQGLDEQEVQRVLHEAQEELREQKDKFLYVFKTDRGSTYYIGRDGSSLRMKLKGNHLKLQPVCQKILFLEPFSKEMERRSRQRLELLDDIVHGKWIDTNLEPREGLIPFEFGEIEKEAYVIEDEGDRVRILDMDEHQIDDLPLHFGHAVSEVLHRPGEVVEDDLDDNQLAA